MLKILLIILAIPVVIFVGLLLLIGIMGHGYEKTDLADKEPFVGLAGTTVTLVHPALLAKNDKHSVKQNPYLFAQSAEHISDIAQPRYDLPAGTKIEIKDIKLFRQKMNGYRSIEVLGTAQIPDTGKSVKFEYSWGLENTMPMFDDPPRPIEWTFPLAPWQQQAIDGVFIFETVP